MFDLTVVGCTLLAALAVSSGAFAWLSLENILVIRIKVVNLFLLGGYLALCSIVFSGWGFYQSRRLSRRNRTGEVFWAVSLLTGVLLMLQWPLQLDFATAQFLFVFWLLTFCTLALSRAIGQWVLDFLRSRGRNLRNVIIVGEALDATALANRIKQETSLGYCVLRIIDAKEMKDNGRISSDT